MCLGSLPLRSTATRAALRTMSLAPLAPFAETTARQVVDHVSAAVGIAMHGLRSAERIGPLADLMFVSGCASDISKSFLVAPALLVRFA